MTEKANPSPNRPADPFKTAGAIAYGGSVDGFIVDSANPTDISTQDAEIDETTFNNFSESSSGSSFTVSIAPGEAFVFGSWIAIDTSTDVSLDSSTTGQTVYIGWNKNTSDDVIIGLDSAFAASATDADEKIPLYDFDTDGSGVTSVTDRRQIGRAQDLSLLSVAEELNIPLYSDTSNAPTTEGSVVAIDGSGSEKVGVYSYDGSSYSKVGNSDEEIEDTVAGLITGGNAITVNYDDGTDTLTINNDLPYTDEDAEDAIAAALSAGNNIDITYDDPNDTIIVDTTALNGEEVQDEVNTLLTSGTNISLTYDDANGTLTVDTSALNSEEVQDEVNSLITAGDNITTTYDDTNDTLTISSTDLSTNSIFESDTGVIKEGNYGVIITNSLADGQTISVTSASYHSIGDTDPVTASPTNTELSIIDGNGAHLQTILAGGSEDTEVTGSPVVSYQNTTGARQDIVIGVDNGQVNVSGASADIDIQANVIARIE
jgi:hypothetical protein